MHAEVSKKFTDTGVSVIGGLLFFRLICPSTKFYFKNLNYLFFSDYFTKKIFILRKGYSSIFY